jgi:hypothetical protein
VQWQWQSGVLLPFTSSAEKVVKFIVPLLTKDQKKEKDKDITESLTAAIESLVSVPDSAVAMATMGIVASKDYVDTLKAQLITIQDNIKSLKACQWSFLVSADIDRTLTRLKTRWANMLADVRP